MASNSETGHAKNVANFEDLINVGSVFLPAAAGGPLMHIHIVKVLNTTLPQSWRKKYFHFFETR